MPKKAKKILITTETQEITIIRQNGRKVIPGNCNECAKEVEMLTFDAAIGLTGRQSAEILVLIKQSEVHSFETTDGDLLVCYNSLFRRLNGVRRV